MQRYEDDIKMGCTELVWKVWTGLIWLRIGDFGWSVQ
jgi:hypothetical protein